MLLWGWTFSTLENQFLSSTIFSGQNVNFAYTIPHILTGMLSWDLLSVFMLSMGQTLLTLMIQMNEWMKYSLHSWQGSNNCQIITSLSHPALSFLLSLMFIATPKGLHKLIWFCHWEHSFNDHIILYSVHSLAFAYFLIKTVKSIQGRDLIG